MKHLPFRMPFLGSKPTQAGSGTAVAVQNGFLSAAGTHLADLWKTGAPFSLGAGTFGLFNAADYLSVTNVSAAVTTGKPLIMAMASPFPNAAVGSDVNYLGSWKSRIINPRYITEYQKFNCAAPEQAVCHLGNTNFTSTTTLSIAGGGTGYTDGTYLNVAVTGGTGTGMTVNVTVVGGVVVEVEDASIGSGYVIGDTVTLDSTAIGGSTSDATFDVDDYGACEFKFYCGNTYNLNILLTGSPVLGVLGHMTSRRVSAYTGCCPVDSVAPVEVDSTLVMIQWAKAILENEYLMHFIRPIVYDQAQNPLFATSAEAVAAGYTANDTFDQYTSPGYLPGTLAGIRFATAYVDTVFGTCSYKYDDYNKKDVVRISSITMVDDSGNPCAAGLCYTCETTGYEGRGFGEDVLKEFIDESQEKAYKFSAHQRYREIEQGNVWFSLINRSGLYTRYRLVHKVPTQDNHDATFSSTFYELSVYVPCNGATSPTMTNFEAVMTAWLTSVNSEVSLDVFTHTPFVYAPI